MLSEEKVVLFFAVGKPTAFYCLFLRSGEGEFFSVCCFLTLDDGDFVFVESPW